MEYRTHKTGRMSYTFFFSVLSCFDGRLSAAILSAFLQCPAFFCGCTTFESGAPVRKAQQIYIQWSKNPRPEAIDVFFFDTSGARNLDAYQRVQLNDAAAAYGLSCRGGRQLVALSASPDTLLPWARIRTYSDLCKYRFSLTADSPERPLLSGEVLLEDGASRRVGLTLRSHLVSVRLRSVSCDFRDRPYAGTLFRNDLIYLQYAGAEVRPLGTGNGAPVSFLNPGWLDSAAVLSLPRPELLLQPGVGEVGPERVVADRTFWCYANPAREAALGSPVTRLVLEGVCAGKRCYYPIELPGLRAGCSYEISLTLRAMGSPDPDLPVRGDTVLIETATVPWEVSAPCIIPLSR